jgi:hypothetical protein
MSAIVSFLGGSAFRAIWGGISKYIDARQEHRHELERMELQGKLDASQHERNLAAQRLQSELGIKVIETQGAQALAQTDAEAFSAAVKLAATPTGIPWVDGWNGSIRPAYATVALALWVFALYERNWLLAAWDMELSASIAGFYFADRALRRSGRS